MSEIIVTGSTVIEPLPVGGAPFVSLAIAVTDNSGVALPLQDIVPAADGTFTASFTGTDGPGEVSVSVVALDADGNNLGTVDVATETGTGGQGGQPGTFLQPTGTTVTVTG